MKRRAVQDSATRPHSNQMKGLNKRNTNEDTVRMSTGEFFKPTAAATARPTAISHVIATNTILSDGHNRRLNDARTPT